MAHVSHHVSGSFARWWDLFGSRKAASAISQFYSYSWQVDNELRLGYYIGGQVGLINAIEQLPEGFDE